jgi:hypothetical protein
VDVIADRTEVHWELASPEAWFDPDRYLGEFRELPSSARPGEWCTVTVVDERGEMRFTLVVVEPARTTSLFEDRRAGARNGGRGSSMVGDGPRRDGADGNGHSRVGERGTRTG